MSQGKGKVVLDNKLAKYGLTEADLIVENGHRFVEVTKLGLLHKGMACLDCGFMRRADGKNKACKGPVKIEPRKQDDAQASLEELGRQLTALQAELLTPETFQRLVDWLREDPIRPASAAFTASIERQIGYALEMDVIPEIKRLRIQLANSERENQRLRAGEYICHNCGIRKDADRASNAKVPF